MALPGPAVQLLRREAHQGAAAHGRRGHAPPLPAPAAGHPGPPHVVGSPGGGCRTETRRRSCSGGPALGLPRLRAAGRRAGGGPLWAAPVRGVRGALPAAAGRRSRGGGSGGRATGRAHALPQLLARRPQRLGAQAAQAGGCAAAPHPALPLTAPSSRCSTLPRPPSLPAPHASRLPSTLLLPAPPLCRPCRVRRTAASPQPLSPAAAAAASRRTPSGLRARRASVRAARLGGGVQEGGCRALAVQAGNAYDAAMRRLPAARL